MKYVDLDNHFFTAAMKAPYLEKDQEIKLITAFQENNDQKALDKLAMAHLRLVIAIAYRFKNYGLPIGDLVQEGSLGMMEAVNRFDLKHEVRFSTYASWWIRASIQDYILKNWSIVRGGTSSAQKTLFFNLRKLRARLNKTGEEYISDETRREIAQAVGVSVEDVSKMESRLAGSDISLNTPVNEFESDIHVEKIDFLVDDSPLPDEMVGRAIDESRRKDWLKEAMVVLNKRELDIIRARRLNDQQETLETLGTQFGISKERVRQIENSALRKLQQKLDISHPGALAA